MSATISETEFARIVAIREGQLAWFLGAGASASAGVPTAAHMIAGFKADLYAAAQRLDRRDIDLDDELWQERINRYFDGANGFPPASDPREYEAAFIAMYPAPEDRRRYIAAAVERGTASYGQRILGGALASGSAPLVFTTNFDNLIEQATSWANELLPVDRRRQLRVAALTSTDVARRSLAQGDWPLLVKLHGDYQSDSIKNTGEELQSQDATLRTVLTESLRRFGLVVAGYSGRDESVMEALEEGLSAPTPYPNGLFWVVRTGSALLPRVEAFLVAAEAAGVTVHLVASETFDELLAAIARQIDLPSTIVHGITVGGRSRRVIDVTLPTTEMAAHPALRFNALPILEMPTRMLTAKVSIESEVLRASLKENRSRVDATSNGHEVLALGSDAELRKVLGEVVLGVREPDPIGDTVSRGLLLNALTRALAGGRPLQHIFRRNANELIIRDPAGLKDATARASAEQVLRQFRGVYGADLYGTLQKHDGRRYAEGVHLRLEYRLSQWWLIFDPFTWVAPHPDRVRPDPVAPWVRERWFPRRNKEWAAMVAVWASVLAPASPTSISAWRGDDSTKFIVGSTTAWAVPGQERAV